MSQIKYIHYTIFDFKNHRVSYFSTFHELVLLLVFEAQINLLRIEPLLILNWIAWEESVKSQFFSDRVWKVNFEKS